MMLSGFPASLAISREAQMPTNVGLYIIIKKKHTKNLTYCVTLEPLFCRLYKTIREAIVSACTLSRMQRVCMDIFVQPRRHSSQSVWQKKKAKFGGEAGVTKRCPVTGQGKKKKKHINVHVCVRAKAIR